MITIKQLEAFYWSAELAGLEAAALRLNTTQSAISKRLQELESVLGFELFDRSRRRAQLTARGEELLSHAKEMIDLRTRIMDMSKAHPVAPRTLRLGVTELTALTWLPQLIQRIRGSHPGVTLEPVVDTSAHLIESLKLGGLDMVVVPDAFRDAQFDIVPLDSVEYSWMCNPSYLKESAPLPLKELTNYTIIGQLNASGLGMIMKRWLTDNRVNIDSTLSSSNLTALASLTMSGMGISYLPRKIFEANVTSGQLSVIRTTPAIPRIPYVIVNQKADADDFLRFVISVAVDTCDFNRVLPNYFSVR
jgi:DNA-binding transcriptional LysR family regulator